jgi:hypothetical protein
MKINDYLYKTILFLSLLILTSSIPFKTVNKFKLNLQNFDVTDNDELGGSLLEILSNQTPSEDFFQNPTPPAPTTPPGSQQGGVNDFGINVPANAPTEQQVQQAEETQREEEAQKAEQARLAEEAKKAEEARKAEEAKAAEEARVEAEQQAAEDAKAAEEAAAAEEAQAAEEEAQAAQEAEEAAATEASEEENLAIKFASSKSNFLFTKIRLG